MTARASFHGTKQRNLAERKAAMATFLYGCNERALADVTVDELGRRYGIEPKLCEYELVIARRRRI